MGRHTYQNLKEFFGFMLRQFICREDFDLLIFTNAAVNSSTSLGSKVSTGKKNTLLMREMPVIQCEVSDGGLAE